MEPPGDPNTFIWPVRPDPDRSGRRATAAVSGAGYTCRHSEHASPGWTARLGSGWCSYLPVIRPRLAVPSNAPGTSCVCAQLWNGLQDDSEPPTPTTVSGYPTWHKPIRIRTADIPAQGGCWGRARTFAWGHDFAVAGRRRLRRIPSRRGPRWTESRAHFGSSDGCPDDGPAAEP